MNIALEKESYIHSFLEKESSSVGFFLMVFLSGVYTSLVVYMYMYIPPCKIWRFINFMGDLVYECGCIWSEVQVYIITRNRVYIEIYTPV